jgi:exopolysaccharide biosynthesis protein
MKNTNRNRVLSFESWSSLYESSNYNNKGFSFDDIMKVQSFLVNNNFMNSIRPNGKTAIDGMLGLETEQAIITYQKSKGLTSLGELTPETLNSMNLSITKKEPQNLPSINQSPNTDIKLGVEKELSKNVDSGEERIEIIDPSIVKVVFSSDFRRLTISEWMQQGFKNFVNLTFFESSGKPTSNFYSNGINLGDKLDTLGKYWPMMVTKPNLDIVERATDFISPEEAFSGSHIIVKDGVSQNINQSPKDSAIRPRTAVGITSNNDIIVMVSPRSDIESMGEKMQRAGAKDAINMDGGGSSFFVRDGQVLISTNRAVPTILAW